MTTQIEPQIEPQEGRDEWFLRRIDPYDDRIRDLERFRHRMEADKEPGAGPQPGGLPPPPVNVWPLPPPIAGFRRVMPDGGEYVPSLDYDLLVDRIKFLEGQLATSKTKELNFARGLMNANARLAVIGRITAADFNMPTTGEKTYVPKSTTLREFQQAGSL